MIATLNDLDILSANIRNAYLNASTKDKVHTICGIEFGHNNIGRIAVISRALYGLKSSGAAWRTTLASTLNESGFKLTLVDPDVWMRPTTKEDGTEYYEYIFVYVDETLAISEKPSIIIKGIGDVYRLKKGSVLRPTSYLGATIKENKLPDRPNKIVWSMSADKYVKEAITTLEIDLLSQDFKLTSNIHTPLATSYRPESDFLPLLDDDHLNWYQQLIGVLRWTVELSRIDTHLSMALLAQYLAQPRVGHLHQAFCVFAYLKTHPRSRIILDDSGPYVYEEQFTKVDWTSFYPDAHESIPINAPPPRGNQILISCFVDSDHAGNHIMHRSRTGIIIFCNQALIICYSKHQNTVEMSSFGSECITLKNAVEMIEAQCYKLCMVGIPITGPANIYCDNNSVVNNTTILESTLNKKHNSITYHKV